VDLAGIGVVKIYQEFDQISDTGQNGNKIDKLSCSVFAFFENL
jgi:hypothetical protein